MVDSDVQERRRDKRRFRRVREFDSHHGCRYAHKFPPSFSPGTASRIIIIINVNYKIHINIILLRIYSLETTVSLGKYFPIKTIRVCGADTNDGVQVVKSSLPRITKNTSVLNIV